MPKKIFSKLQSPQLCLYHSQGFSYRHFPPFMNSLYHESLECVRRTVKTGSHSPVWEVVSNHMQNQCQWKSNSCWAPSPPAYTHPPNKLPFWPWHWNTAAALSTALHTPLELNRHHNCSCSLIAGRLSSALKSIRSSKTMGQQAVSKHLAGHWDQCRNLFVTMTGGDNVTFHKFQNCRKSPPLYYLLRCWTSKHTLGVYYESL